MERVVTRVSCYPHPGRKNKDAARMGHPALLLHNFLSATAGPSATLKYASPRMTVFLGMNFGLTTLKRLFLCSPH
jgi:hypothetical protein